MLLSPTLGLRGLAEAPTPPPPPPRRGVKRGLSRSRYVERNVVDAREGLVEPTASPSARASACHFEPARPVYMSVVAPVPFRGLLHWAIEIAPGTNQTPTLAAISKLVLIRY